MVLITVKVHLFCSLGCSYVKLLCYINTEHIFCSYLSSLAELTDIVLAYLTPIQHVLCSLIKVMLQLAFQDDVMTVYGQAVCKINYLQKCDLYSSATYECFYSTSLCIFGLVRLIVRKIRYKKYFSLDDSVASGDAKLELLATQFPF